MHRYYGVKFFRKADPAFSGTLYDRSHLSIQAFAFTEEVLFHPISGSAARSASTSGLVARSGENALAEPVQRPILNAVL